MNRREALKHTALLLGVSLSPSAVTSALAQLSRPTGDTVTKGRRAPYFNSYASMIQRTLARDFASLSRGGVLVWFEMVGPSGLEPLTSTVSR